MSELSEKEIVFHDSGGEAGLSLKEIAFCDICGAARVPASPGYACCPNGHGKLYPKLSAAGFDEACRECLHVGWTMGKKRGKVQIHVETPDGTHLPELYTYLDGRRAVGPLDEPVHPRGLIASVHCVKRELIRELVPWS